MFVGDTLAQWAERSGATATAVYDDGSTIPSGQQHHHDFVRSGTVVAFSAGAF
eukprot:COSAG01_NODE_33203_length_568_cov_0.985075_1_plen_52_part_01